MNILIIGGTGPLGIELLDLYENPVNFNKVNDKITIIDFLNFSDSHITELNDKYDNLEFAANGEESTTTNVIIHSYTYENITTISFADLFLNQDKIFYLNSLENYYNVETTLLSNIESFSKCEMTFISSLYSNNIRTPVVFISTDKVYIDDLSPHEDNDLIISMTNSNIFSQYILLKVFSEKRLIGFDNIRIIRPFNFISKYQYEYFGIHKIIKSMLNNEDIYIYKNIVNNYVSLLDGTDLAALFLLPKLFSNNEKIINMANVSSTLTVFQIIEKIREKIEPSGTINYNSDNPVRDFYLINNPQINKLSKIYLPQNSLDYILDKIIIEMNGGVDYITKVRFNNILVSKNNEGIIEIQGKVEPDTQIFVILYTGERVEALSDLNGDFIMTSKESQLTETTYYLTCAHDTYIFTI